MDKLYIPGGIKLEMPKRHQGPAVRMPVEETILEHPVYGIGAIVSRTESVADVKFLDGTTRKMGLAWLGAHCAMEAVHA